MGLTYYDAKRLWEARLSDVSFDNIITCSHLQLYLHASELDSLRQEHRVKHNRSVEIPLRNYRFGEYADRFWQEFLDVKNVQTMDYSEYENASIVHDLNHPVPERLHGQFDAVIEAGSLEHIFNFPVAIANLMRMTKAGGRVFLSTPANNLCGHGFYQFSPELMYRVFSPENGFEQTKVVFIEGSYPSMERTPIRGAYQVADPATVHSRVGLVSERPVTMIVDSKKTRDVEPFAEPPQQSDYVVAWETGNTTGSVLPAQTVTMRVAKSIFSNLPARWQQSIHGYRERLDYSFRNKHFYQKLRDSA
jgi:SAM-dependent methyltransferase